MHTRIVAALLLSLEALRQNAPEEAYTETVTQITRLLTASTTQALDIVDKTRRKPEA